VFGFESSIKYILNPLLDFSEKNIQFSIPFVLQVQTSWNQAHAPLSLKAFQKYQEHNLKHSSLTNLITTKQNKTTFLPP
jgi:HKD family nuclease